MNNLEKNQRLECLLETVQSSENDGLRIENLKCLLSVDFGKYNLFHEMKKFALSDHNPEIRYLAIKILHRNYPVRGKSVIEWAVKNNEHFNIPIINLGEKKRYNINDIISYSIEKMKYKERMINNIINTKLFEFLLDWQQFSDIFRIYYEINLQSFILIHRIRQLILYLCCAKMDPFYYVKIEDDICMDDIIMNYPFISTIHEKYFKVPRNELIAVKLIKEKNASFPSIKVFDTHSNIISYLE